MRKFTFALALFGLIPLSTAAADEATDRLWGAKCASCHGKDGKGKTRQGEKMKVADMTSPAWQKEFTPDKVKKAIVEGVNREKDGVKQEMKPLKDKITPEQVDALAAHVKSLK